MSSGEIDDSRITGSTSTVQKASSSCSDAAPVAFADGNLGMGEESDSSTRKAADDPLRRSVTPVPGIGPETNHEKHCLHSQPFAIGDEGDSNKGEARVAM